MTSKILFVETNKILTSTFRVERSIEEDGVLLELKNNIGHKPTNGFFSLCSL